MNAEERNTLLKSYIERLNQGEALEDVQKDFRQNFKDVDPSEIVEAEKQLIQEGTALTKIQKLCDIHSALFHGSTREEKIQNAEKEVMTAMQKKAMNLTRVSGHPLNIFVLENEQLSNKIQMILDMIDTENDLELHSQLQDLSKVSMHYDKKDELILPLLKRHGIPGPSDVMWNVDGELRQGIKQALKGNSSKEEVKSLLQRMQEMIYKEEKILFPLTINKFSDEEWQMIYYDMPKFGYSWLTDIPDWQDAKPLNYTDTSVDQKMVALPTGTLTIEQLEGILHILPVELTFVDNNEINQYFSEDSHLFPRPLSALHQKVFSCHPPKVTAIVQHVIDQLKSGEKDMISFVTSKKGRKCLVRYMAVRSKNHEYLGVLEVVEDITDVNA